METPPAIQINQRLASHTTIQLGGPARYFAACRTLEEIRYALRWAAAEKLPVQVLGGGSNVLFADEGYAGLVLKVELAELSFTEEEGAVLVEAAAGQPWDGLVAECVGRGLAGIECLSGIPGLVGATPIQNVGAYGQEVKDTILEVRGLDRRTLEPVKWRNEECGFAYRQSHFKGAQKDRYLITQVAYRLEPEGAPQIRYTELRRQLEAAGNLGRGRAGLEAVREAVLRLRRKKSMVLDPRDPNSRSVGSFFLNPVLNEAQLQQFKTRLGDLEPPTFPAPEGTKVPAAWLIEQVGFPKGYRRQGAGISANHTLALVNCGGNTRQVLELAEEIRAGVRARFGIALELEPVVVPWNPTG
jgi:UDP-N-acetylmuramate dehydrogenase